ncbi:hypothetical protein BGZ67_004609 [Mortierella alpina]|nr:hypothetical protein BGZ67_004609 [Mortierella alpina]
MATVEDDRKQRFRFHKDDEILLLQIVLRAKPCPYKISSRDGAIMVAWNSIAEEFKVLCKPRHDGIVPHSRTCRTRTDKLIADFLANRATAHLRPQKQETKEDKVKNSLVTKLAAIQGKIEAPPPDPSDPDNNTAESPIMPGSASGTTQLNTPAHLLTQGSSSVPSSMSDLQLHGHSHSQQQQQQQQQRVSGGLSTTTLMPQSLVNIGSSNGHRMNHGQSPSELLAASSSLLLATTSASGGGLHHSHHQNSSPPNIFSSPGSDQRPRDEGSQQQASASGRKRRGNRNSTFAAAAAPSVSTNQPSTTDYLQRPASAHPEHHAIIPASKRLRSGVIIAQNHSATPTNTFDQQNGNKNNSNSNSNSNSSNSHNNHNNHNNNNNNNSNSNSNSNNIHIPNHARPFPGGMGTSLGSNLPGQDMAILSTMSTVGGNDDGHDEDDDGNEDDGGEDSESDSDGNGTGGYQHDRDDDFGNTDYDGGYGQQDDAEYANQTDASALLSLQNGSFSNIDSSKNNNNNNNNSSRSRNNKSSKRVAKRTTDRGKVAMSKYNREVPSSNWPVPMPPANTNSSNSNEAGSSTAGPGYFVPSQLNAEDRAYLMRTLALEEQRVKVEVEKIALERERLALERSRLQWEMRQMN